VSSTHWTSDDLPEMSGKTVIITGASGGLGALAARELGRVGAHVVLAVRDTRKGEAVAWTIDGSTEVRELDLASLTSVSAFANRWAGPIDVLINNAGLMQAPEGRTSDGFELQIGTNHLGPFALTNLLLPAIIGRVVTVSSELHKRAKLDLDDLNWERRRYDALQAYRASKLANVLFSLELEQRFRERSTDAIAVTAHPGIARTTLAAHVGGLVGGIQSLVGSLLGQEPEQGVLPILFAATQAIPGASYVGPDGFAHLRGLWGA
jgi:NAD(P)-dependent dehydrogenase (short-subunit alcohol dehydrogenase family)